MDGLNFEFPNASDNIIKVIGVGGGGGNAVNHMFSHGEIHDVSFVLCNTDNQALKDSEIPTKIQIGKSGLGAGAHPEVGKTSAEESAQEIKNMLSDGTKMVFITAGMGGGTGTGAAPVIAKLARDMGILTVGIVTIPFLFEGTQKILKAIDGVEEIAKNVDALLVINNEKLRTIYSDLTFTNAFKKADDTLLVAVKSIADIITMPKKINLDFADVQTTLKDGGVAIMATGVAKGDNRITNAIKAALESPLLSNKDIFNSKRILLCVSFSLDYELIMEEIDEIHDFMKQFKENIEVIWGGGPDSTLKDEVKITILATGFGLDDVANKKEILGEEIDTQIKEGEIKKIGKYYGPTSEQMGWANKRLYSFIFDKNTIDNDDVIFKVTESPTYLRDKQEYTRIKQGAHIDLRTEEVNDVIVNNGDGEVRFIDF